MVKQCVVEWRRYGIMSRKVYIRISNVLFHINYLEKPDSEYCNRELKINVKGQKSI
jgi:hypothetical protein